MKQHKYPWGTASGQDIAPSLIAFPSNGPEMLSVNLKIKMWGVEVPSQVTLIFNGKAAKKPMEAIKKEWPGKKERVRREWYHQK